MRKGMARSIVSSSHRMGWVALAFQRPKCSPEGLDEVRSVAWRQALAWSSVVISNSWGGHLLIPGGAASSLICVSVGTGRLSVGKVPCKMCFAWGFRPS